MELRATDQEVDRLVATKLLGFTEYRGAYFSRTGRMYPLTFSPTGDVGTALRVLRAFQRKGWVVALYDGPESEVVLTKDSRVFRGRDTLPGRAVCIAALASIGLEVLPAE